MNNVTITLRKHVHENVTLSHGVKTEFLITLKSDTVREIVFKQVSYLTSAIGMAMECVRDFEQNGITPIVLDPENILEEFWSTPKGQRSQYGKCINKYIPGKMNKTKAPVRYASYDSFKSGKAVVDVPVMARTTGLRVTLADRL